MGFPLSTFYFNILNQKSFYYCLAFGAIVLNHLEVLRRENVMLQVAVCKPLITDRAMLLRSLT